MHNLRNVPANRKKASLRTGTVKATNNVDRVLFILTSPLHQKSKKIFIGHTDNIPNILYNFCIK